MREAKDRQRTARSKAQVVPRASRNQKGAHKRSTAEGARASGERKATARVSRKKAPPKRAETSAKARPTISAARPITPTQGLERAMAARTPRARAIWARRGLASARRIDATTQSMLLRQLYLAYYEERRFAKALDVSCQAIELAVLPDVAHQDAARAAQALGDVETAAGHLRLAARTGPPTRRAFHLWTLGSLFFVVGRHADAIAALSRAARWGTTDKPLYQGHLAVVRCAGGESVEDLPELIDRLASVPAGQGYGRFVLGQLAFYGQRWDDARSHLEAFIARTTAGRAVLSIALDSEITLARKTLAAIPAA